MNVVIRADASTNLGIGHVMRCLTLATSLRERGAEVCFICREHTGHICDAIAARKFEVRRLPAPPGDAPFAGTACPAESLGATWDVDVQQSMDAVAATGMKPDWVVVDHYAIDERWEKAFRVTVERVMAIDDIADRAHDCDLLLDQNLYDDMHTRYGRLVPTGAQTLLGPLYALLRPQFAQARCRVRREGPPRRALIFFGGSDPTNETSKVLEAVGGLRNPSSLRIEVLVGPTNPHREAIERAAERFDSVTMIYETDEMQELILRADLAICAGGSTSWERCCLGLPSVTIAVARNQVKLSMALAAHGYQRFLGTADSVTVQMITDVLDDALRDFADMLAMGKRGMNLVDGLGAGRVVTAMRAL